MMTKLRWGNERLFVLVGEQNISTIWVKQNWRGQWCAHRIAHASLTGELSADSLAEALRHAVGRVLSSSVGIHWFLPPDVLAVAMVAKTTGNPDGLLNLPFVPGQVQSMSVVETTRARSWLWMHAGWLEAVVHAGEAVGAQTLYVHPRSLFVGQLCGHATHESDKAGVRVLRDARCVHLFVHGACVRSFTHSESADGIATGSTTREQAELNTLVSVLGLTDVSAPGILQVNVGAKPLEVTHIQPASGDNLHRNGLLCHSLAKTAERRIRTWAFGVSALILVVIGGAWSHQVQIFEQNQSLRLSLREAVPLATKAKAHKELLAKQTAFLTEANALNDTPDLFQALGQIVEKMPAEWTLTALNLHPDALTISVQVPDARKLKTTFHTNSQRFPVLTAQPEADIRAEGKSMIRVYTAQVPNSGESK